MSTSIRPFTPNTEGTSNMARTAQEIYDAGYRTWNSVRKAYPAKNLTKELRDEFKGVCAAAWAAERAANQAARDAQAAYAETPGGQVAAAAKRARHEALMAGQQAIAAANRCRV